MDQSAHPSIVSVFKRSLLGLFPTVIGQNRCIGLENLSFSTDNVIQLLHIVLYCFCSLFLHVAVFYKGFYYLDYDGRAVVGCHTFIMGCPRNIWTFGQNTFLQEGQGLTALAASAGGAALLALSLSRSLSLSLSLWETARYKWKHCLKGLFNQKQSKGC